MKFFSRVTEEGTRTTEPLDSSIVIVNDPPQHPSVAEESQRPFVEEDNISTECTQVSKRKRSAHDKFIKDMKVTTGLDLLPAPSMNGRSVSQCATCLAINVITLIRNQSKRWVAHGKKCPGLMTLRQNAILGTQKLTAEAQAFVMYLTAGGETHRKNTCDAYVLAYWLYKHKLPFTTGNKLREVLVLQKLFFDFDALVYILLSYQCIGYTFSKGIAGAQLRYLLTHF